MDIPGYLEITLTLLALVVFATTFWPVKTRLVTRRGWEPGYWDLKVWPARVHFFFKGHETVRVAYREAKDTPYMLQTLIEDVLVVPPKYLPELRMLPGNKLNASEALVASVLGKYSGIDVILKDRQAHDITRLQLTRSLPNLLPSLSEKADQILSEKLNSLPASDFTEVRIQDWVADLILRTTLLAFVGPEFADNTELHKLINAHTNLVRDIAIHMLFVPAFIRGWVRPILLPSIRMRRLHKRMREILFSCRKPVHSDQHIDTLLQHFIGTSKIVNEEDVVGKLLVTIGAALHTMTLSTTHAIIDLCAYPIHVPELRAEFSQKFPSAKPPWPADAVGQCSLLDSFLKESQRFNSPNYLSFDRLAMARITLSSGFVIPQGTYICMPAGSMAMDSTFYSSPHSFSPSRFHNNSLSPNSRNGNQDFVGTESGNIHWGSGRFTCPGRWYASAMMKTLLALVINGCEIKFPNGQSDRLPNVYMDILVEPNPNQTLLIKRR